MNTDKIETNIQEWADEAMKKKRKPDCDHEIVSINQRLGFCKKCRVKWEEEESGDFIDIKELIRKIYDYQIEEILKKIEVIAEYSGSNITLVSKDDVIKAIQDD